MSLETTVLNLAVEVRRRLGEAGKRDDAVRQRARVIALKIAVGTWLLAGNLLRVAGGNRVQRQRLSIRTLQAGLQADDQRALLATLDHAVEAVHWQLTVARRSGSARRSEHLIADFVEGCESDLARLGRVLKP